ncbi:MAG: DNA integrity scanning protein DisA nucleotide-binding domain protein [Planctomycetes bacterium]|nr:DNA integrity scanning protein DisA nucleotide-binding domain protein [Planctomycetota bacterium]
MPSSSDRDFTQPIIAAAVRVAGTVKAQVIMVYIDALENIEQFVGSVKGKTKVVFIARDEKDAKLAKAVNAQAVTVPAFNLTRMGQIKMATIMAFSQGLLRGGETFVFVSGVIGHGLDTLVVMQVGAEYELFQTVDQPKLTEHIRQVVFQRVLSIALALAHEGREGKPVGALFVVGDFREVQKYCQQNIINPFHGYTDKERNILDDGLTETVKEFATIDGAFVIKGTGVIASAGTTLRPAMAGDDLPQGLGTRHLAAAAITASTKSIALTVSESTGNVRIWRRGKMITELEKAPRTPTPAPPSAKVEPGEG